MIETWFAIGLFGMALGTLPPLKRWVQTREDTRIYATLAGITGIAAVAYTLMFLGVGVLTVDGRTVFAVRYVDWLLTTPLMVLYLALLAGASRRTVAALLAADVVVIGAGTAATLVAGPERFALFALGAAGYVALLGLLLVVIPRSATFAAERDRRSFLKLRNLTVVLWSLYPVVWLLGPAGFGLMLPETMSLVVVYLDLISKGVFVFVAVRERGIQFTEGTDETHGTDVTVAAD
jgi:sensory rhodopsin